MKYLISLLVALIVVGCYTDRPAVFTKEGDIACGSDYDCPEHYRCGFKHVDTRPVCIWDGWDK